MTGKMGSRTETRMPEWPLANFEGDFDSDGSKI